MNTFQEIFDKQKAYFDSDATKSYEWRIDQLTRLRELVQRERRGARRRDEQRLQDRQSGKSLRDHGSRRHRGFRESRVERMDEA